MKDSKQSTEYDPNQMQQIERLIQVPNRVNEKLTNRRRIVHLNAYQLGFPIRVPTSTVFQSFQNVETFRISMSI